MTVDKAFFGFEDSFIGSVDISVFVRSPSMVCSDHSKNERELPLITLL